MRPGARTLAGTFLLTTGGLLFEVALTRLLSLVHYSGFVFALLSLALLGLGLGSALVALAPGLRAAGRQSAWASLAGVSAALAVAAAGLGPVALLFPLAVLPFLFSGMALGTVFSLLPGASHRLYWADLLGAGSGTLLAIPLLGLLSPGGTALAAGLLLACAALLLAAPNRLSLAVLVLLVALQPASQLLAPDMARQASGKPIAGELRAGAQVVALASDAFATSHLIRRPGDGAHYLYVDGAAGSLVPLRDDPLLTADIGFLPFRVLRPESVFLLGSGGGLDASLARLGGASRIVAAELNGAGLRLVEQLNPAAHSGMELHVDEGRSVLRRQPESFDLIMLSHVITQSSDVRGFALSEASSYTSEAFADYLAHLNPGGVVALKLYDELTLSRAFFTAYEALQAAGAASPADHLLAVLDQSGGRPLPLLLIGRDPLAGERMIALARAAEEQGFALLYLPGLLANPPLDELASGTSDLGTLVSQAAAAGVNLSPVHDLKPYFFQFETGLPAVFRPVAIAAAAVLLVLVAFLLRAPGPANWRAAPFVFSLLGAGFMLLELGFIQRTQLTLGHPTLALTLVLAVLLFAGGCGSLIGSRLPRPLSWAPLLAVVLTIAWHLAWPQLGAALAGPAAWLRGLGVSLSLLPVGLVLGMQLPAGLRQLQDEPGRVAAAWAVNGVGSVLGSVAAVTLALLLGQQAGLYLGTACYLAVFLLSFRLQEPG